MMFFFCVPASVCVCVSLQKTTVGEVNQVAQGSSLLSLGTCPSRRVIRMHESSLALIASKDPRDAQKLIFSRASAESQV